MASDFIILMLRFAVQAAAIAIPKDTSVEGLKIFIGQQFVEPGPKFVEETVTTSIIIIVIIAKFCRIVTYIA